MSDKKQDDRLFEFAGHSFQVNKIDALRQFHLVRRLTPILKGLLPQLTEIQKKKKNLDQFSQEEMLEIVAQIAMPVMDGLSQLSDEDAEKVLMGLLFAVEIKQKPLGNWARLSNGSVIMFQDLGLAVLLAGAGRALAYNLAAFFAELPQSLSAGEA